MSWESILWTTLGPTAAVVAVRLVFDVPLLIPVLITASVAFCGSVLLSYILRPRRRT